MLLRNEAMSPPSWKGDLTIEQIVLRYNGQLFDTILYTNYDFKKFLIK